MGKLKLPTVQGDHARVFQGGARLSVLLFAGIDCPVSNRLAPEYGRLSADYAARGVAFRLVYTGDEAVPAKVRQHGEDYQLRMPALLDERFILAGRLGGGWTPEAFLCTGDGRVLYHGRVNNLFEDYGRMRPEATVHDLRRALDEVLAGRPVSRPFVRPVGCHLFIPASTRR